MRTHIVIVAAVVACVLIYTARSRSQDQAVAVQQESAETTASASVPKVIVNADYAKVTSKLEPNGTLYFYANLEGMFESIIDQFAVYFESNSDEGVQQIPDIARKLVKSSGFDQLNDIGFSLVKLDNGLSRLTSYLLVKEPVGLLQFGGGKPDKLDGAGYIPEDVSLSSISTVDLTILPALAEQGAADIAGSKGKKQVRTLMGQIGLLLGADLIKLLESTAGQWGYWFRLDPDKEFRMNIRDDEMVLPMPGLLIMLKVKDTSIYELLERQLKGRGAKLSELSGIDGIESGLELNVGDTPFGAKPVIAQTKDWLLIGWNREDLDRALEAHKTGKNFQSSPDYIKLAAGLPELVNSITFMSPKLGKSISDILDQIEKKAGKDEAQAIGYMKQSFGKLINSTGAVIVGSNDEEGFLTIMQGDVSGTDAMRSSAAVPIVAVLGAIAVPNFLEAQVRAKVARTKNDMRTFATGIESYYVDNSVYPPSTTKQGKTRLTEKGVPISSFASNVLTTPISYMTSYYDDPFAAGKGSTFGYYAPPVTGDKNPGWILFSPGPDETFDLGWEVYDTSIEQPSEDLVVKYTYDPTNGTVSGGDVWRVKQ